MAFAPEQHQALAYARRYGSEATVESIRTRLSSTFTELEAQLRALPTELTGRRPSPAKWSLHEIVDHLAASHRRAVDELRLLVRGSSPSQPPIPAGLLSPQPFARPWPALLDELELVHRDLLALVDATTESTPLVARASVVLVVKCTTLDGKVEPVEWIESFDWKAYAILVRVHTLEHLQQVQRTLAALGHPAPTLARG